jgi:hypothetical protein
MNKKISMLNDFIETTLDNNGFEYEIEAMHISEIMMHFIVSDESRMNDFKAFVTAQGLEIANNV